MQLALLHLFQGVVNVGVLTEMGRPDSEWCVPELHGLTHESGIALLDRAADVGLVTPLGVGGYAIHPAVPWFLRSQFDAYFAGPAIRTSGDHPGDEDSRSDRAKRAFVEMIGRLGDDCHKRYGDGDLGVIAVLAAEEANLLHARRVARQNGWWWPLIVTMQGLQTLYAHRGRRTEWKALVNEIEPTSSTGPPTGRDLVAKTVGISSPIFVCASHVRSEIGLRPSACNAY